MAARNCKFLLQNSMFHRLFSPKLRTSIAVRTYRVFNAPQERNIRLFVGNLSNCNNTGILNWTPSAYLPYQHEYQYIFRKHFSLNEVYRSSLKDEVKLVLSKAPTKDDVKNARQLEMIDLLCRHKTGEITSADVTAVAKDMNADHLYELALAVYSLKDKVGAESIEFWAPLFRMASLNGSNDAKYTYAQMLRTGTGVNPDLFEAAKLFRDLSDVGHPYAQFALAGMFYHGIGLEQDFKSAFDLYEQSSKNGVDMALSMLGNMYLNGESVEQNSKLALQYFQTGVQKGDPGAELSLAYCYSHGKGVTEDLEKAFDHHMSAANKGHPIALYNVGTQYFSGKGVEANMEKAAEYFQYAADLGFDLAQINLGNMYYNGLGVEKDWARAKELYRQAAATNKNGEALLKEVEEDERKMNEKKK